MLSFTRGATHVLLMRRAVAKCCDHLLTKRNSPPELPGPASTHSKLKGFDSTWPISSVVLMGSSSLYQKNPRVRKNSCPQFWGWKWVRQFYGRLEECVLSAGKPHVHKLPRFRGGVFWVWGGGSADFIFMGARIFLPFKLCNFKFPGTPSLYL